MEISTSVYFHMIKKRLLEEDKRNFINMDTGMVLLHPDLILQIQQGALVGKLLV